MPSNAFSDLGIQDPVPTVSTPALAEESPTMKHLVYNFFFVLKSEALVYII